MEKKFEEKFGLKTEEMDEILGGLTSPVTESIVVSGCWSCSSRCFVCYSCVACESCSACQSFSIASATGDNTSPGSGILSDSSIAFDSGTCSESMYTKVTY
jgi:hypothetical protein